LTRPHGAVTSRHAAADRIAAAYRCNQADDVAHLGDDDLHAAIIAALGRADAFGLSNGALRARFMMLDVFRAPGFWADPDIHNVLTRTSGTPDIRFGDACGMLKCAAVRAGRPDMVWW
jgi:hypothetical protein